jgi:transglutaminase-like putative cysteine protease
VVGDFDNWFEAYIGGRWQMFDPRNNVPRIGLARARCFQRSITQTFGPTRLVNFKAWTDDAAMITVQF